MLNVRFFQSTIGLFSGDVEDDISQMVNAASAPAATDGADIVIDLTQMALSHMPIGHTVRPCPLALPDELRRHSLSAYDLWFSLVRSSGSGQIQEIRVLSVAPSSSNRAFQEQLCLHRHLAM